MLFGSCTDVCISTFNLLPQEHYWPGTVLPLPPESCQERTHRPLNKEGRHGKVSHYTQCVCVEPEINTHTHTLYLSLYRRYNDTLHEYQRRSELLAMARTQADKTKRRLLDQKTASFNLTRADRTKVLACTYSSMPIAKLTLYVCTVMLSLCLQKQKEVKSSEMDVRKPHPCHCLSLHCMSILHDPQHLTVRSSTLFIRQCALCV